LVVRALDYAVGGKVRSQDSIYQLVTALKSDENREQAWTYIQKNWEKVQPQLTPESGASLVSSTGNFCSAGARSSVERFFAAHKVHAADQYLKHALESIDGCIELRALQEPKLKQWLAAQPKP
jgi:aminopeptidase N/puromycin-sensitive aminopeptidase